jgi:hypothetical protein
MIDFLPLRLSLEVLRLLSAGIGTKTGYLPFAVRGTGNDQLKEQEMIR